MRYFLVSAVLAAIVCASDSAVLASPQLLIGTTRNITRHAIVGRGFVERNPDLSFHETSGPIATGPGGTVYATIHNIQEGPQVYVYKRGETKPYRHFYVYPPNFYSCDESYGVYATALAVDHLGFVYVGYWNGFSYPPQRTPLDLGLASGTAPCDGIEVFPPNANERTKPLFFFGLPDNRDFPTGMRVASDGTLYVLDSLTNRSIFAFANPSTQPVIVRSMTWPEPEQLTGLALDDKAGTMYVASACIASGCFYGRLYTFPEQFTPSQTPLSSFFLPFNGASWDVESFDSKVFVSSLNPNTCDKTFVYSKVGPLRNRPIETLDVSGPLALSL